MLNIYNLGSLEVLQKPEYVYSEELKSYVNKNGYISVIVNNACQCNCPYCINSLTDRSLNIPVHKAIDNISRVLEKFPGLDIILLGGEPTLHPELFDLIKSLRNLQNVGTLRITTNGIRLRDKDFLLKLINPDDGVQGINISFHNYNRTDQFISLTDLSEIYQTVKEVNSNVLVRVNSNIWKGNLDSIPALKQHIQYISLMCDQIRLSNLILKDSFSVNPVNDIKVEDLILSPSHYSNLFFDLMKSYADDYSIICNPDALGFVKYFMIPRKVPVIINYNLDSRVSDQIDCENSQRKINTFKCLVSGDISLSWNTNNIIYFLRNAR